MLEAVYPQFDTIYRGMGIWLKQNRFDLKLLAYYNSVAERSAGGEQHSVGAGTRDDLRHFGK